MWLENCSQILQRFLVSIPSSGLYHIYVDIFWRTHFFNCCGKALGGLLLADSEHCCFNHSQITSRWVSVTQRWRIFITFINSARIPQTHGKCTILQHAQACEQGHKKRTTQETDAACRLAGMPLFLLVVVRLSSWYTNSDYICKYNTLWGTQCPEHSHLPSHKAVFFHLASKCHCRRPLVTMRIRSASLEISPGTYCAWKQHQMHKFKAPKSVPQWCGIFKSSSQLLQIWYATPLTFSYYHSFQNLKNDPLKSSETTKLHEANDNPSIKEILMHFLIQSSPYVHYIRLNLLHNTFNCVPFTLN